MRVLMSSFKTTISQTWAYQEKFFYSYFFLLYALIARRMHAKHVRTHARTYAYMYVHGYNYAREAVIYLSKQKDRSH